MLSVGFVPLLLLASAALQQPPADPEPVAPDAYEQEQYDDMDQAEPAPELVVEEPEPTEEPRAEEAEEPEEWEEEVPMVCRRVNYEDDFGRMRSRRSCRPRDE